MTDFSDLTAYKRGTTVISSAVFTDASGNATDPTTYTCGYIMPDGTTVAAVAMTKDSTGHYHLDYDVSSNATQGVWRPFITAVSGTRTKISESEFLVTQ